MLLLLVSFCDSSTALVMAHLGKLAWYKHRNDHSKPARFLPAQTKKQGSPQQQGAATCWYLRSWFQGILSGCNLASPCSCLTWHCSVLTQKAARRMQVSAKNWICHLFTAKIQLSALFRKHFFEIYKRAFGARPYRAKGAHVHAERTSRKHTLGTSTTEFPKADKLWDACLK